MNVNISRNCGVINEHTGIKPENTIIFNHVFNFYDNHKNENTVPWNGKNDAISCILSIFGGFIKEPRILS